MEGVFSHTNQLALITLCCLSLNCRNLRMSYSKYQCGVVLATVLERPAKRLWFSRENNRWEPCV